MNQLKRYINKETWRVNENANSNFSIGGLGGYVVSEETKKYWLDVIYPKHISDAHKEGYIHIHDLNFFGGYCSGWSLRELIAEGLHGETSNVKAKPAKHYFTIIQQMVNFIGIMSNEWAGAQAFSSVDTYLAPFIHYDKLSYSEVKQGMQFLCFGLSIPNRWSQQSPFSNFTFDWIVPEDLKNQVAIIGGAPYKYYTYGDFQKEMDMFNKAFMETMLEGDANGRGFSFPIPTYNITKEFDWDSENAKLLCKMTGKYGIPYFQNFINSDLNPSDVRSMCCRLRLDKKQLIKKANGLFGAGELTGSIGVVTLNLPMIYMEAVKQDSPFFSVLTDFCILARDSLEIKRKEIKKQFEAGLYPYTKTYIKSYDTYFSTIGIIGMNELLDMWLEKPTLQDKKTSAEDILEFLKFQIEDFQETTGNLYNLEATPAEGASFSLCKKALEKYPDCKFAGTLVNPYFTNSSQLPVNATEDLFEALELQDSVQCKYTGGTVFHAFIHEKIADEKTVAELIKTVFTNFKLPYFSITPTYSVCPKCGYLNGEQPICLTCGKETEVWSRIVGYYRPINNWNIGKIQEFSERKTFKIK